MSFKIKNHFCGVGIYGNHLSPKELECFREDSDSVEGIVAKENTKDISKLMDSGIKKMAQDNYRISDSFMKVKKK